MAGKFTKFELSEGCPKCGKGLMRMRDYGSGSLQMAMCSVCKVSWVPMTHVYCSDCKGENITQEDVWLERVQSNEL